MAGMGSTVIMGMDFGKFAEMMAESLLLVNDVIKANANAGLGIGFSIKFVTERCRALGIR